MAEADAPDASVAAAPVAGTRDAAAPVAGTPDAAAPDAGEGYAADAADVPLPDACFDLAVSEYGASLWCDPDRWVPEAARLLRPGGRLVFHTTTVLVTMCLPEGPGYAGRELLHPQRDVARVRTPDGGVEFHRGHGEWIAVLRRSGFTIDALHELYAQQDAQDHPYYDLATADWARQWPVEEVWVAHLPA